MYNFSKTHVLADHTHSFGLGGRTPGGFYWDVAEAKLLVVHAQPLADEGASQAESSAEIICLFSTDNGLVSYDRFA